MWAEIFRKNGLSFSTEVSLKRYTSLGIGGAVPVFLEPKDSDSLICAVHLCHCHRIPYRILGNGTNVIATDALMTKVVISTRRLNVISKYGSYIEAECGVPLCRLAEFALEQGMVGVAGLHDIPGTVGAAIRGNASAFEDSSHRYLESVRVYDVSKRSVRRMEASILSFGYRFSAFLGMKNVLILSARFAFPKGDVAKERERIAQYREKRRRTQPVQYRNCGSVFCRYDGVGAGYYLEAAGCKGIRRGGAEISALHANFILNVANATSDDVLFLIDEARERVYHHFGILLTPEVEKIP